MEIKSLVKNLVSVKQHERSLFIEEFLENNDISFNIQKYPNGKNIEVVKKGLNPDKEIIFFSHYDISNDTIEGANDNSSSVAIMLSVAKFIQNKEISCTVKIIFNDREEILGALLDKKVNADIFKSSEIINQVGSFQYLKNYINRENIKGIFDIELSGIGNTVFFAINSGNVECSAKLIDFLSLIAEKNDFNYIKIPFLASDMISIHTLGLNGIVLGAIPDYNADIFPVNHSKENNVNFIPSSWKNIHSVKDNYFAIQERSLNMIYNFVLLIINNAEFLERY
jgi:hypothetical protein